MDVFFELDEKRNRSKSRWLSILIHIGLVLLALLPLLSFPVPPPGQKGILVNLGLPDEGMGNESAPIIPKEAAQKEKEQVPEIVPIKQVESAPPKIEEPSRLTTDSDVIIERKKREEEKKKADELAAKKAAEEEANRKAEEEAARVKAQEKARIDAEAAKTKSDIGGLFGGQGTGQGNTGRPGNQGDPDGDPNAGKLEGISTGAGMVGGGLGNRGVVTIPKINDRSQKEGKVVINVCVDKAGKVLSADFTQRGSTTTDPTLVRLATDNARLWKFMPGDTDRQCGTITYQFKLN
jgi:outer membrane biosynthesis protein TonB